MVNLIDSHAITPWFNAQTARVGKTSILTVQGSKVTSSTKRNEPATECTVPRPRMSFWVVVLATKRTLAEARISARFVFFLALALTVKAFVPSSIVLLATAVARCAHRRSCLEPLCQRIHSFVF